MSTKIVHKHNISWIFLLLVFSPPTHTPFLPSLSPSLSPFLPCSLFLPKLFHMDSCSSEQSTHIDAKTSGERCFRCVSLEILTSTFRHRHLQGISIQWQMAKLLLWSIGIKPQSEESGKLFSWLYVKKNLNIDSTNYFIAHTQTQSCSLMVWKYLMPWQHRTLHRLIYPTFQQCSVCLGSLQIQISCVGMENGNRLTQ